MQVFKLLCLLTLLVSLKAPSAHAELNPAILEALESPYKPPCRESSCRVWVKVSWEKQNLELYINGDLIEQWPVVMTPTRKLGRFTFSKYAEGRLGGTYHNGFNTREQPLKEFGSMPYAVYINRQVAISGTPDLENPIPPGVMTLRS